MSAAVELLAAVRYAGGTLAAEGDALCVEAPARLSENLVEALRRYKPELLALLGAVTPEPTAMTATPLVIPGASSALFHPASGPPTASCPSCGCPDSWRPPFDPSAPWLCLVCAPPDPGDATREACSVPLPPMPSEADDPLAFWRAGVAHLSPACRPTTVPPATWAAVNVAARAFLADFGREAALHRWPTWSLFGVHRRAPLGRLDGMGLVLFIAVNHAGARPTHLNAEYALLKTVSGTAQRLRRPPRDPLARAERALLWDLK